MPGDEDELEQTDASLREVEVPSDDQLSATPKRAANIGGGGQADNTCDCATVGLEHPVTTHSVSGAALFVVAFAVLFARRLK